tara:strand:+ start:142 stop:648 length:507 start_codon:yes stop_codon:yes gene_type:complete
MKMSPDKISLMSTVLTALIIVASLLLLNKINRVSENFVEKCEPCPGKSVNDIRNEQIKMGLGNKDVDTVFGTPVAPQGTLSHANNQENAPDVGGGNKSLFLFKHNDCSPECCDFGKGTDVSCSGGCVCYNKEQNNIVASRGDGVYPSKHSGTMSLKPHQPIVNDRWSK